MKKQSLTANEVKSYLESINPYSEELYISNIKKVINLKKDGFIQVDYSVGVWTFLQCKEKYEDTKSKINETKISFSNTLNI